MLLTTICLSSLLAFNAVALPVHTATANVPAHTTVAASHANIHAMFWKKDEAPATTNVANPPHWQIRPLFWKKDETSAKTKASAKTVHTLFWKKDEASAKIEASPETVHRLFWKKDEASAETEASAKTVHTLFWKKDKASADTEDSPEDVHPLFWKKDEASAETEASAKTVHTLFWKRNAAPANAILSKTSKQARDEIQPALKRKIDAIKKQLEHFEAARARIRELKENQVEPGSWKRAASGSLAKFL